MEQIWRSLRDWQGSGGGVVASWAVGGTEEHPLLQATRSPNPNMPIVIIQRLHIDFSNG
jgi:hypothetical protein